MNLLKQAIAESAQSIDRIRSCQSEMSLHAVLCDIFEPLSIHSYLFIFHSLAATEVLAPCYRLLIGCMPEFTQLYAARKWYVNDPSLLHARKSCEVLCLDALPMASAGQRELREMSRSMGFRSGVAIPVHSGHADRFGVLLLGSDDEAEYQSSTFSESRVLLRSVAMELLEWWLASTKEEARQRFQLSDTEIAILTLQRREYRGADIACELGVSPKTVHNAVRRIKEKFGAANISGALYAAESYGLI